MGVVSEKECSLKAAGGACRCEGACTGYDSRSDCPPLIVIAVMAVAQAVMTHCNLPSMMGPSLTEAGAQ
jgi:hypothetical protein